MEINVEEEQPKVRKQDPLHGVTLKMIVTQLEEKYGWKELAQRIKINCFVSNPSINSSLKFLRKTPWARESVEALFLETDWSTSSIWATSAKKLEKKNS